MSLIGSTSFGFAQNTIMIFKIRIELIVALSSTNATKIMSNGEIACNFSFHYKVSIV